MAFNIWTGVPIVQSTLYDSFDLEATSEISPVQYSLNIDIQQSLDDGIKSFLITSDPSYLFNNGTELGMSISATVYVQQEQKYYVKYIAESPYSGYYPDGKISSDVIIDLNDYKEEEILKLEIKFECVCGWSTEYGGSLYINIFKNELTTETENKQIQKIWIGTPEGNKEITDVQIGR